MERSSPHLELEAADDEAWLRRAIALADDAAAAGDVPVAAILRTRGRTFFAQNERERRPDPTAHAEILALRQAAATLGSWRLGGILYVTKEPCTMCAGAIVAARVERVAFGCRDPKGGAAGSVIDVFAAPASLHRVEVTAGVCEDEAATQLRAFFARKRGAAAQGANVSRVL